MPLGTLQQQLRLEQEDTANSLELTCLGSAVSRSVLLAGAELEQEDSRSWKGSLGLSGRQSWKTGGSVAPPRSVPADVFATRYSVGGKFVDGRRSSPRALSRRLF